MTGSLLMRGLFVGLLAGLLAFTFAKVFGEPQVDRAIAFEEKMDQMKGEAPEPELVSREVQSTVGLLTGVLVYSASMGGLFALAFAYCLGRVGRIGPRGLSALLAFGAFVAVIVVPELKYPANPPSVGDPDTIRERTKLFFLMLALSVAAMVIAVNFGRKLVLRHGAWTGTLVGAGLYLLIVCIGASVFPAVNEVPADFSATDLWDFRIAALGIQLVLWASLALMFGWLTERDFVRQGLLLAR